MILCFTSPVRKKTTKKNRAEKTTGMDECRSLNQSPMRPLSVKIISGVDLHGDKLSNNCVISVLVMIMLIIINTTMTIMVLTGSVNGQAYNTDGDDDDDDDNGDNKNDDDIDDCGSGHETFLPPPPPPPPPSQNVMYSTQYPESSFRIV